MDLRIELVAVDGHNQCESRVENKRNERGSNTAKQVKEQAGKRAD